MTALPADDDGGGGGGGIVTGTGTGTGNVVPADLNDEMSRSYLEYALSVIYGRALPDVRDGLKPVHRRILHAMNQLNLSPDSSYRKCARVVGDVLGRYHPHGDVAVYDALVRLAQPFSMRAPLVDGHGNFGSVDNDPPAAMRYTECRLTALSKEALLADIDRDTVGFAPNFDGSESEPTVLPARVPNLLLNGSSGIAVGMATNVPPHNLRELVSALHAMIADPELSDAELERHVPAPDFPTGGFIMGLAGSRALHHNGQGSVIIRSRTSFETIRAKGRPAREAIVVSELPYQTNKAALLERIAEMVNEKKLEGIADLRDESDREGMRVVIEVKRDADRGVVLNNLFKKTALQTSFGGNMLALVGRYPTRLSLRRALQAFLDFRAEVVRRRAQFDLSKARERGHVVQGLLTALRQLDAVIETVRGASDVGAARAALTAPDGRFALSERQADAILSMQLRRLTQLESHRLEAEHADLVARIADLEDVLARRERVMSIISRELDEVKRAHGAPRRSEIMLGDGELSDLDMIANDRSVVLVTRKGYVKRMPLREFEAQHRGTRGKSGAKMREDDTVAHFFSCHDHDTVLAISTRGVAYGLRAFQIPLGSRVSRGVPLSAIVPALASTASGGYDGGDEGAGAARRDEQGDAACLASIVPVHEFRDDAFLVLLTKRGWVKKTPLAAFASMTARGLIVISLGDGDELRWVRHCSADDTIVMASTSGRAVRFRTDEHQLRPTGRQSRGVRSMRLRPGDSIADMDILHDADARDASLLAITRQGMGKRVRAQDFRVQSRGCMGVTAIKFKGGARSKDRLVSLRMVQPDDEVVLITKRGTLVRQQAGGVSVQGRPATGVCVQRLDDADMVAHISVAPAALEVIGGVAVGGDEDEDEDGGEKR